MPQRNALYLGFGVSSYDHDPDDRLPAAVTEVRALRGRLRSHFTTETLIDPTEAKVRRRGLRLQDHFTGGGVLVVLWSGHGEPAAVGGLKLYARDTTPKAVMGGIPLAELAGYCATSGASQILIIVDACYSGAGIAQAEAAAEAIVAAKPPDDAVWIGVLTACGADEVSYDGELGQRLLSLLKKGPVDRVTRAEWSAHNELIRGDQLALALNAEWSSRRQAAPRFRQSGYSERMLPNPLFDAKAPPRVVEHLLAAARGGRVQDDRVWFTGRHEPMTSLVGWIRRGTPGLYLVTGSPGTGKSALLGRLVSLSDRRERRRILRDQHSVAAVEDPGLGSVAAHLNVRRLTPDGVAERLSESLVDQGWLPGPPSPLGVSDLLDAADGGWARAGAPVVVVDGVDEARGEAFDIVRELLVPLARQAVVLASSRAGREAGTGASLLRELRPADTVDLDQPDLRAQGLGDIHAYILGRLKDVDPVMAALVADHFVSSRGLGSAQLTDRPFLLARLVTDQLRDEPIDTSGPRWQERIAPTIQEAFEKDLAASVLPSQAVPTVVRDGRVARAAMAALPWAGGAGFPEEEWRLVANVVSEGGPTISREDLATVLDRLGRYIVQDGEAGQATYRVFHQSLADYLRPPFRPTSRLPFAPFAGSVADALLGRVERLARAGSLATASPYLLRYAVRHAELAGPDQLHRLAALLDQLQLPMQELRAALDRVLAIGVQHERGEIAARVAQLDWPTAVQSVVSRVPEAPQPVPPEELGPSLPAPGELNEPDGIGSARGNTAMDIEPGRDIPIATTARSSGQRLGWAQRLKQLEPVASSTAPLGASLGRRLLERAVSALEGLAEVAAEGDLDVGGVVETAVLQLRRSASTDPTLSALLARGLAAAGQVARRTGDLALATSRLEEASSAYRALGTTDDSLVAPLVQVVVNLSEVYAATGRHDAAMALAETAAMLVTSPSETVGAEVEFAALANLGVRFADVGRLAEALEPSQRAVELGRRLVAEEGGARLPMLAQALNNLGNRLVALGRHEEGLAASQEAVVLMLTHQADLVELLNAADVATAELNQGQALAGLGRHVEAYDVSASALRRLLDVDAPEAAVMPHRAAAYAAVGHRLAELGRAEEARDASELAASLYRGLAADDPRYLADLAAAESNLANRYLLTGQRHQARQVAERAVDLYRELAADNPGFQVAYAQSLGILGEAAAAAGDAATARRVGSEAVNVLAGVAEVGPLQAVKYRRALERRILQRLRPAGTGGEDDADGTGGADDADGTQAPEGPGS
ncbi:MAG TPA: tetratricopeptide repeat protein [Dermatophilaceae bacterium]|nr:tetratricopeptide repeat protein [Dermatophilaceae bacterium]